MRFIVALWRFAIAGFCFVGTYEAWSKPQFWVYFTFQTGFVLGIVMLCPARPHCSKVFSRLHGLRGA